MDIIIIPDKTNDHTMFSQVHEIAHGIYAYKHLGKSVQSEYYEVLPLLVEKLYVEESNNEEVKSYSKYLDSMIDESDNISYKFALYARNQLLEGFNGNIDDLDNQCDLLLDSYENEHKL